MIVSTAVSALNKSDDKFRRFTIGSLTSVQQIEIEKHFRFTYYSERWKKETGAISSVSVKTNNAYYKKIIGMGRDAVQFIRDDLERNRENPHFWFPALQTIIGDGPTIPGDVRGNMKKIARIWLSWIEENVSFSD